MLFCKQIEGAALSDRISVMSALKSSQNRTPSSWSTLILAFLFLMAANLSESGFLTRDTLSWMVTCGSIVAMGAGWIILRKDDFGFLLAVFVCAHFNFAEASGGLWTYILAVVMLVLIVLNYRPSIKLSSVPRSTSVLVLVLLIQQIIGTILNHYSLTDNIEATVVTCGQLLVFYYCASQKMNESNLKRLLSVWFVVVCWVFIMGLNQRYHWVITSNPLLPLGGFNRIPSGSFGNMELFGEYFCFVFVFFLVIVGHLKELSALRIKMIFPVLMVLMSVGAIVMGGSRAAVLLALAATFYIVFLNCFITPSFQSFRRAFGLTFVLCLVGILILKFGSHLFIGEMIFDFNQLNPSKMTMETVISGKSLNRGNLFTTGYQRLSQGSWWIGNGYNLPANNRESMGFKKYDAADFHNLYLALPFYYGWMGAIAYVLLVLGTGLRVYLMYLTRVRQRKHFLIPVALGFAILWGVFLLDEYKISVTRNPNYFLLIWMLLGWTHAVVNSIRWSETENDRHRDQAI